MWSEMVAKTKSEEMEKNRRILEREFFCPQIDLTYHGVNHELYEKLKAECVVKEHVRDGVTWMDIYIPVEVTVFKEYK